MATARKLPSGSWRVLIFDGMVNGKRHYASITGATKKEAEWKAAQYAQEEKRSSHLTVAEALDRYITAKTNVLSPSTIKGYRQMEKVNYEAIKNKEIFKLTTEDMQLFVSDLTVKHKSPKTVANIYGLLSSAVVLFRPDKVFRVTLPKRTPQKRKSPTNEAIVRLLAKAPEDMKLCIALAAFGSLRRGEICGLKYGDVSGNVISVHADLVEDEHGKLVYKEIPKTSDSVRVIRLPDEIIQMIGDGDKADFIVKRTPIAITRAFTRLCKSCGLKGMRFHDLRHYYASVGAVLGVPDVYMSEFGGWKKGSGVMKEVYQNVMESAADQYRDTMIDHFTQIMQHEMQHEKERTQ